VREQVLTVIGEAKHGLWRAQDNGMVRLYRKKGAKGVPVGANVYDPSHQESIKNDYKAVLIPGIETSDEEGWEGYRYSQTDDGDGKAAFVDVPIYHDYFEGKYNDHPVMDLPHFGCFMSDYNFKDAKSVWEYIVKQPIANKIGPLGIRAGLDIKEHYTSVIRLNLLQDANIWIQVGMGDLSRDVFDQTDIDNKTMDIDVAFRILDTSKVRHEIYLVERAFMNVPYVHVIVVMDNKKNKDFRYTRPDGLYWEKLKERGLAEGLKTTMTFDPNVPVINSNGDTVMRTMRYTPVGGLNHLDDQVYGGNWCPQKGGDYGYWPENPSGSGFPNQYEEATPICDAVVVDIKMYANLYKHNWASPTFQLQNAGTAENPQVYIGEGNQYGDFTDDYHIKNGIMNPHKLYFTSENNPKKRPLQAIKVQFEGIGETSKWVHPETGKVTQKFQGLFIKERQARDKRISMTELP